MNVYLFDFLYLLGDNPEYLAELIETASKAKKTVTPTETVTNSIQPIDSRSMNYVEKNYKCEHCTKTFESAQILETHERQGMN